MKGNVNVQEDIEIRNTGISRKGGDGGEEEDKKVLLVEG